MRKLAKLGEGSLRLADCLRERRACVAFAVGLGCRAGELDVVGEGEESLLGPVVKVALQPAPAHGPECPPSARSPGAGSACAAQRTPTPHRRGSPQTRWQ